MTIKPLENFRKDFVECEIVVLIDISARTVLAWDGALKWPQEHLDDLCNLAASVLAIGGEMDAVEETQTALLARATGCFVFVRAAPKASEVLCCVFAPEADVDDVLAAGKDLCADLLGADQLVKA